MDVATYVNEALVQRFKFIEGFARTYDIRNPVRPIMKSPAWRYYEKMMTGLSKGTAVPAERIMNMWYNNTCTSNYLTRFPEDYAPDEKRQVCYDVVTDIITKFKRSRKEPERYKSDFYNIIDDEERAVFDAIDIPKVKKDLAKALFLCFSNINKTRWSNSVEKTEKLTECYASVNMPLLVTMAAIVSEQTFLDVHGDMLDKWFGDELEGLRRKLSQSGGGIVQNVAKGTWDFGSEWGEGSSEFLAVASSDNPFVFLITVGPVLAIAGVVMISTGVLSLLLHGIDKGGEYTAKFVREKMKTNPEHMFMTLLKLTVDGMLDVVKSNMRTKMTLQDLEKAAAPSSSHNIFTSAMKTMGSWFKKKRTSITFAESFNEVRTLAASSETLGNLYKQCTLFADITTGAATVEGVIATLIGLGMGDVKILASVLEAHENHGAYQAVLDKMRQPPSPVAGGARGKERVKKGKRSYVVRSGPRGGRYIIVNKRKEYVK